MLSGLHSSPHFVRKVHLLSCATNPNKKPSCHDPNQIAAGRLFSLLMSNTLHLFFQLVRKINSFSFHLIEKRHHLVDISVSSRLIQDVEFTMTLRIGHIPFEYFIIVKTEDIDVVLSEKYHEFLLRNPGYFGTPANGDMMMEIISQCRHFLCKSRSFSSCHMCVNQYLVRKVNHDLHSTPPLSSDNSTEWRYSIHIILYAQTHRKSSNNRAHDDFETDRIDSLLLPIPAQAASFAAY